MSWEKTVSRFSLKKINEKKSSKIIFNRKSLIEINQCEWIKTQEQKR